MSKRPTKKETSAEDAVHATGETSEDSQASEEAFVADSTDADAQIRSRSRRALTAVVVLIVVFAVVTCSDQELPMGVSAPVLAISDAAHDASRSMWQSVQVSFDALSIDPRFFVP